MAVYYAQNHLYPDNPQVFITDVEQIVTAQSEGDPLWHIVFYTSGLDSSGDSLGPYHVNAYAATIETFDELVESKIAEICDDIDWTRSWYATGYEQGSDHTPPKVVWTNPTNNQTAVPIGSSISVRLADLLPSKGIDLSSITMTINGITITPTITGNKYDCTLHYTPVALG